MNKKFDVEKCSDYFAELAASNPEQLPLAFLELMKQRLVLTITNRLREVVETSLSELEKQLRKELDSNNDKESY
ncbi:hypothetical protein ES703_03030 [subsurface metagenome]